jgi:hypothetical protein
VPSVHDGEVLGGFGGFGGGGGVAYSVVSYMGWDATSAPNFSTDVDYTSTTTWNGLNVINYEPAHYPNFNQGGSLILNNGQPLPDPSFQTSLATDFPPGGANYGNFVNYIVGNPEITIYNDLKQLQAAGFNGVRLYGGEPPKVYVATIQAAYQLSQVSGHHFYVYYEVGTADLSGTDYYGGTVAQRETTLYTQLVSDGRPPSTAEGTLQILHYVINIVGPAVFSQTVPVVFFSHEMLVSPKGTNPSTLTDDNSSTPLLQWGVNATRALLKKELGANPLPAVSTAIVAGQVVQVSTTYQPEVKKLIDTIQHDAMAPISYDVYPFQWGDRYFDQKHDYVNDSSVIANAYPAGAQYYDNTSWTGGPLPTPSWTVPQTVTKADLMWSLQWMTDRVNWIWGHLANKGDQTGQLIAETGWASDGTYQDASLKPIMGNLQDAKDYYDTLKPSGFKVANAPIMYFMAYDVPWKDTDSTLFSENHYGVLGWSNLTKVITGEAQYAPLTRPFAVLALAPTSGPGGIVYANSGQTGESTAYSYQIANESAVNIPWFWGSTRFSNGQPNGPSITWIPSPAVLLSEGSTLTITSPMPGTVYPKAIELTFSATAGNGGTPGVQVAGSVNPSDIGANLQQSTGWSVIGNPATLYMAYAWLHDGTTSTANMVPIYEDFWAG